MKVSRMQMVAGACCLAVPLVLGAQAASMSQDATFLMKASQGGMSEIQMGQLASQKASSPKVKEFGQKMVTDHTMLNNDLKPFADKDGVAPPTGLAPDDQAELDKLQGLSGKDFDKEYVAYMMKDHEKDLADFKQEVLDDAGPAAQGGGGEGREGDRHAPQDDRQDRLVDGRHGCFLIERQEHRVRT